MDHTPKATQIQAIAGNAQRLKRLILVVLDVLLETLCGRRCILQQLEMGQRAELTWKVRADDAVFS